MYETTRLAIGLRMARAAVQLTQSGLAAELGVTKIVIARNEKPDMAMRADTLVRLIYVLRQRGVELDVFSTLDSVRLYMTGGELDAAAMRISRAALSMNQQDFADCIGLTKAIVTRGERPGVTMRSDTWHTFKVKVKELGVVVDWVPMVADLTVVVNRQAIERIETIQQGSLLPGEPGKELIPASLEDNIKSKNWQEKHRIK
ncbi:hypothetical protein [Billgrantia antri]|uniref:HTH cro/C1-type domain-containing protein n=1 Tax=Billgrantia antri TaxID=2846777 RepID=A0ABS6ZKC0_9GAMM|nr:hypothetical protein [Halomonas antri]MBW6390203.1 hypothetical protein [Halomonas antri]